MQVEVGNIVRLPLNPKVQEPGYYSAKVVYIHPEMRFILVEFEFNGKIVRECYCPKGPTAAWAPDGRCVA